MNIYNHLHEVIAVRPILLEALLIIIYFADYVTDL